MHPPIHPSLCSTHGALFLENLALYVLGIRFGTLRSVAVYVGSIHVALSNHAFIGSGDGEEA